MCDVSYQVFRKDKLVEDQSGGYACFSSVREFKNTPAGELSVMYKFMSKHFLQEQIEFFHQESNRWGFTAEHTLENGKNYFKVVKGDTYLSVLAPLVMRRYLEEMTGISKIWFDLVKRYPDIETFSLFQISHYEENLYYNSNHAFLSNDIYNGDGGKLRKIVPVEVMRERVKEFTPSDSYVVGLNKLISLPNDHVSTVDIKTVQEYYKANKIAELIELMS